jgi:hypothetical protein
VLKLRKALTKYRPERGRAFSFISVTLRHFLICRSQRIGTYGKYHVSVEQEILENHPTSDLVPNEYFNDFWPLLQQLQTRFTETPYPEIQRRMVAHILSRDGRLWNFGSGRGPLLDQLQEKYQLKRRDDTRKQLELLYQYVIIQLRRLLYAEYAPKLLTRPRDPNLGRLWDEMGAETFTKLVYVFADIIPALTSLRPKT